MRPSITTYRIGIMKTTRLLTIFLLVSALNVFVGFAQNLPPLHRRRQVSSPLSTTAAATNARIDSLTKVLAERSARPDTVLLAVLTELGYAYRNVKPERGVELAQRAVRLADSLAHPRGAVEAYRVLGWCNYVQSRYAKAMEAYLQGQKVAELAGLTTQKAQMIQYKAILFRALDDVERALQEHLNAAAIMENAPSVDSASLVDVWQDVGIDYRLVNKAEQGLAYLMKTMPYFEHKRDTANLSINYNNIGECYMLLGDYKRALQDIGRSLAFAEHTGQQRVVIFNCITFAHLYTLTGGPRKGIAYALRAVELAESRKEKHQLKETYKALAAAYAALGQYPEAHRAQLRFVGLHDSIYYDNLKNNFALQQTDVEARKKDAQIQLLTKDQEQQRLVQTGLVGGVVLMLLVAGLLWRIIQVQRRATAEILHQQDLLTNQAVEIENVNSSLHEQNLALEVSRQSALRQAHQLERTSKLLEESNIQLMQGNERLRGMNNEIEEAYQSVKVLSTIGQEITATLDIYSIGMKLYEDINRVLDTPIIVIGTYSAERGVIDYTLTIENGKRLGNLALSMTDTHRPAVQCVLSKEPVIVQEFQQTALHGDSPGSLVYIPLINAEREVIGVFSAQSYHKQYFTEQSLNFLFAIVPFVVSALSNANAYSEVARVSQELRFANAQLSTLNQNLETGNLELKALNDEKSEMMSIVAHDLKNPIGAVAGFSDILREPNMDEASKNAIIDQLSSVSNRMLELVTNVLDAYRMEGNNLEVKSVAIDVVPVAGMALDVYRDRAAWKHIQLHFAAQQPEMVLIADERMLNQVLDNIISNAVKYSPHGKNVHVKIRNDEVRKTSITTDDDQPTNFVRIEVQDEGEGISAEDMKRLFGKFARLSARPTGGEHSTGLGLSIVKKMVEAMRGRVWCESEYGQGATFIVELPAP